MKLRRLSSSSTSTHATPVLGRLPHPFQSKEKGPALSDKIIRWQDDVCSHIIFIAATLSALPAGTVFLPCCPPVFPRPSHYSVITRHWQEPAAGAGARDPLGPLPHCLKSAERTITTKFTAKSVTHPSPREMEHCIRLQCSPFAWTLLSIVRDFPAVFMLQGELWRKYEAWSKFLHSSVLNWLHLFE